MDGIGVGPDEEASGRELTSIRQSDIEPRFTAAGARCGGIEAEGFFHDGRSEDQPLEQVGLFAKACDCLLGVWTKDAVVLVDELAACGWVCGDEVECVTNGATGGVVPCKDKGPYLGDGHVLERGV